MSSNGHDVRRRAGHSLVTRVKFPSRGSKPNMKIIESVKTPKFKDKN